MKFSEIELPSNRKFGFFFTFVFAAAAIYFIYSAYLALAYIFIVMALIFLFITIVNDKLLLPLKKLWMRFGFILSVIVSPILLGIIYLGLIIPYALTMRFLGRDELRLQKRTTETNWISRSQDMQPTDFTKQF